LQGVTAYNRRLLAGKCLLKLASANFVLECCERVVFVSEAEHLDFSKILAYQSAPSILGIKPASLFTVDKIKFSVEENISYFNRRAAVKGLKIRILHESKARKLLIVYNEKLLLNRLKEPAVRAYFRKFGYPETISVEAYLCKLSDRIGESGEFPHEIGLFLGYPVADVDGFIKNKGENYLLCGCWKVYSDENRARRLFDNYIKCRNYLCNKLEQGNDIYQALKIS